MTQSLVREMEIATTKIRQSWLQRILKKVSNTLEISSKFLQKLLPSEILNDSEMVIAITQLANWEIRK